MLPLPNLDDRFFEDIVKEARLLIPAIMPDWTDENEHDPGITFIELLAWLVEMQQYYMNRVVERSELNFLKLLGIELEPVRSAAVDVSIKGVSKEIVLPKGTKFSAKGLVFETAESYPLIPNQIEKILVRNRSEMNDYTPLNEGSGDSFYAFGKEIVVGNTLYIGFEKELVSGEEVVIHLEMFDDYPVSIGAPLHETSRFIPSGRVVWNFFGESPERKGNKKGWFRLDVLKDETCHFSTSGKVTLKIPFKMSPETLYPANDKGRFWISCTVEDASFELSPRLNHISIHHVQAFHRETLSYTFLFDGKGEANESIVLEDYVSFYEQLTVQVKDERGYWHEWKEDGGEEKSYVVKKDHRTKKTTIVFRNLVPKGRENIRVISYLRSFESVRDVGRSNGLPNQSFHIFDLDIIPQSLKIQVGKKIAGSAQLVWEDWERVEHFNYSKAADFHFIYDDVEQKIIFGNNENGFIPAEADVDNIRIIECQVGGGSKGNIKEHSIDGILNEDEEVKHLQVTNRYFARGGSEKETIDEAKRRIQRQLEWQERAVTSQDFEEIARRTPGLRVGRVKALPLYTVGLKDYPNTKVPAQVTLVVVPHSEAKKPIPSKGFLQTIKNHLNKHRLVTTEIHVIPPEYIKITVHATVIVEPYLKGDALKIVHALERLLQPLEKEGVSGGWEFGRPLYKEDIYGAINDVEGVVYVQHLWIEGEGRGMQKEASGNILIPPHGLVYSGAHQIELISKNE